MNEKLQQLKQLCDEENRELFTDELRQSISKILSDFDYDFCTPNYDDYEREDDEGWHTDVEGFINQLRDDIQEGIYSEEIIYYSRAMEYLTEHDTSLNRAFELADEQGYEVKNLNSELLATLVYQDDLQQNLGDCIDEIEDLLY